MRRPPKPKIAGSNPAGCAINSNRPFAGFDLCCAMSQVLQHPALCCGAGNKSAPLPKWIATVGRKTKGVILGRWRQPPKKPWSWYLYPKRYIKEHAEYLLQLSHHLPILICLQTLRQRLSVATPNWFPALA